MKLTIKLDAQDVKQAIATHVSQILGLPVKPDNVQSGTYSWDTPTIVIDTDYEQEMSSIAAEQEVARVTAIQEAS
jgi:hypothetical protein